MRIKISTKVVLFLLVYIPTGLYAEEMPNDQNTSLTEHFLELFCEDSDFLSCVGRNRNVCNSAVSEAMERCDFSPVWESVKAQTDMNVSNATKKASMQFGECASTRLRVKLGKNYDEFEQCIVRRIEKHAKVIRSRLNNKDAVETNQR
ncbi:MAG: hypothetical protein GY694_22155 [Gammaproteobacteria bacterium]|nr:hypothetical protein [Gammaproteobacteria bacterium]